MQGGIFQMYPPEENLRSGYLQQNFRLFHLKDQKGAAVWLSLPRFWQDCDFFTGKVTYIVEGKSYHLKPWDILLVPHHDIHKPVIDGSSVYERIVIWVKNEFMEKQHRKNCDLSSVFMESLDRSLILIRVRSSPAIGDPDDHRQFRGQSAQYGIWQWVIKWHLFFATLSLH